MHNKYFPENEYHTPDNHPRIIWDKLSLGTSFYFNLWFIKFVIKNRRLALNNLYDRAQWALSSYKIFKFIENCGANIHVEGFDNLDSVKDEPVVFVSNHMGTLETMVFPGLIAPVKEVTFVVKEGLTRNVLFGPIMRARNPITVSRNDSRHDLMKVMTEGIDLLSKGTSIVIFPQSTRTIEFIPEKFNSLGVKLAQKAGVRVVPIAIKTDFWANGTLHKDLGHVNRNEPVHIKFGEPMEIKGSGKEEHHKIVDFIQSHLEKWNK